MKRLIVLSAFGMLAAIVAARAVFVSSRQIAVQPAAPIQLDRDATLVRLSKAIQFRTVSNTTPDPASAAEQAAFAAWLTEAFPSVHQGLTREAHGEGALLYIWQGSQPDLPALLLMGHMDVVPVEAQSESKWTHPPFSGAIADGYVWGRGSLDDKGAVLGILEAAEHLIAAGFKPKRTLLFAFGNDEEVGGKGAQAIVKLLQSRGTKIDAVLDEGGIIAQKIVPGVEAAVALVGITEKGYVSVVLQASGAGGHSSMPPSITPVGRIARAIERVRDNPFRADLRGATEQMFVHLAPKMQPVLRTFASNLWLFEPLIEWQGSGSPSMNAALRTTLVPTMISGGIKENVIASTARAVINARILPGDTIQDVLAHVTAAVDDPEVKIELGTIQSEPSPVSDPAAPQFARLARSIRAIHPDAVVAPFMVLVATDARHYRALSPNIYRFMPARLTSQDLQRIHGVDERIAAVDYVDAIRFYRRIMDDWGSQ